MLKNSMIKLMSAKALPFPSPPTHSLFHGEGGSSKAPTLSFSDSFHKLTAPTTNH